MEITFEKAIISDIDNVFELFVSATAQMERIGIHQWDEIYPDRGVLESDIKNGEMSVGKLNNKIVSAYVINKDCDDEYKNGRWKYSENTCKVLHRLCVHADFQNRKLGTVTLAQVEKHMRELGAESVRLDVFSLNPYALKMYDKAGYLKVGAVNFRKGQFYLMEKKL